MCCRTPLTDALLRECMLVTLPFIYCSMHQAALLKPPPQLGKIHTSLFLQYWYRSWMPLVIPEYSPFAALIYSLIPISRQYWQYIPHLSVILLANSLYIVLKYGIYLVTEASCDGRVKEEKEGLYPLLLYCFIQHLLAGIKGNSVADKMG